MNWNGACLSKLAFLNAKQDFHVVTPNYPAPPQKMTQPYNAQQRPLYKLLESHLAVSNYLCNLILDFFALPEALLLLQFWS